MKRSARRLESLSKIVLSVAFLLAVVLAVLPGRVLHAQGPIDTGTGTDGPLTVSGDFNLNADTNGYNGRTEPDGVVTVSTSDIPAGSDSIQVADTAGFVASDEVLVINMQGTDAGTYETAIIEAVGSNVLTLTTLLVNGYDGTVDKIMVQRVPHYTDVTVQSGGNLTANAWDGTTGGVLFFRATGNVVVDSGGKIDLDGKGYGGGSGATGNSVGYQGESYAGTPSQLVAANYGGGGGGREYGIGGGDGGGGGSYGSGGTKGTTWGGGEGGDPGDTYGDEVLTRLYLGSGGGQGGHWEGEGSTVGAGGNGGGIISIGAHSITVNGGFTSNGNNGGGSARGLSHKFLG